MPTNLKKIAQLNQYIETADIALQQAREILQELGGSNLDKNQVKNKAKSLTITSDQEKNIQIIEGVFNGQTMIGPDGKEYSVPANYASKSKLVAGDILKLTIEEDGSFIYKQIKPIERERLTGDLAMDEVTGNYAVLLSDGRRFNVLTASVTYFKGNPGDKVTILTPKNQESSWAAIENILKQGDKELNNEVKEILPPVSLPELPEVSQAPENILPEKKEVEQIINSDQNLDIDNMSLNQDDLGDL